jgi:hypothetical protein
VLLWVHRPVEVEFAGDFYPPDSLQYVGVIDVHPA